MGADPVYKMLSATLEHWNAARCGMLDAGVRRWAGPAWPQGGGCRRGVAQQQWWQLFFSFCPWKWGGWIRVTHDNNDINIQAFLKYTPESALWPWVQTPFSPQRLIVCVCVCMLDTEYQNQIIILLAKWGHFWEINIFYLVHITSKDCLRVKIWF